MGRTPTEEKLIADDLVITTNVDRCLSDRDYLKDCIRDQASPFDRVDHLNLDEIRSHLRKKAD